MLKTVAARGSITAAAQSLALSAGAVSQQFAARRHDVGVDLLRPDGRTVVLTEAGRVLLEHTDRILAAVQEAECAVAAVKGTVGATATLAALPSTVARIVAPALTALGADQPQLAVTCLVTDQAQLRDDGTVLAETLTLRRARSDLELHGTVTAAAIRLWLRQ